MKNSFGSNKISSHLAPVMFRIITVCATLVCLAATWQPLRAAQSPRGAELFGNARMLPMPKAAVVVVPSLVTVTKSFSWKPSAGADWYTLYAGTNSGTYIWSTNATTTNATMTLRIMDYYTHIYWAVRAANIDGLESGDSNEVRDPDWSFNAVELAGPTPGVVATIYKTTNLKTWQPHRINARLPVTNAINFSVGMELYTAAIPLTATGLRLWNEAENHFGGN